MEPLALKAGNKNHENHENHEIPRKIKESQGRLGTRVGSWPTVFHASHF